VRWPWKARFQGVVTPAVRHASRVMAEWGPLRRVAVYLHLALKLQDLQVQKRGFVDVTSSIYRPPYQSSSAIRSSTRSTTFGHSRPLIPFLTSSHADLPLIPPMLSLKVPQLSRRGNDCKVREGDAVAVYRYTGTLEQNVRGRVARPGGGCSECIRVHWYTTSQNSGNGHWCSAEEQTVREWL
jgi:hypothetical protein